MAGMRHPVMPPGARDNKTMKLDRTNSSEKFKATVLDEVLLLRSEYVAACQQSMNAFAGPNEIGGLLPNRKHAGLSLQTGRQGVREGLRSLTAPHGERYRTCVLRSSFTKGGLSDGTTR